MEAKDIEVRLEVIKLLATVGDREGIELQAKSLKKEKSSQLDEIIALLEGNNYRQALYLIKKYQSEHFASSDLLESSEESEQVLDVEDMLRMSPLAKETINDYRAQAYTQEDLETFTKAIEESRESNQEKSKREELLKVEPPKEQKVAKESKAASQEEELNTLVESAHQDVPLDEISANVLGKKEKEKRTKVLSKYKTLREKFARKDKSDNKEKAQESVEVRSNVNVEEEKSNSRSTLAVSKSENTSNEEELSDAGASKIKSVPESAEQIVAKEQTDKVSKGEKGSSSADSVASSAETRVDKRNEDKIYPPIPHIEEKYRQFFKIYPPIKESDVWVEVVIKFLKNIAKSSYTQKDIESFLEEYDYFAGKNDLARAAQVILLAGASDSKLAQFRLARELFNGKVLQRNLQASFEIIKRLSTDFYPEAVCDLAQFYEYGLGVPKDKKVALKLYEKAFEVGSVRASKHINRLKESGGFLSSILKLK